MIRTVFIFEWKKLMAASIFPVVVVCFFIITIYAIGNGKHIVVQQQKNIDLALAREDSVFNGIVHAMQHPDTTTNEAKWQYEHLTDAGRTITSPNKRWTSYWAPSSISYLSVGNRDIYPYYHELEPYSFYMRFFKNEISSPFKLLYGNFDLAFVITLLFPLIIVGLTFDVYSSETENGTYSLLNAVALPDTIIRYKLIFNLAITLILLNSCLLMAMGMSAAVDAKQWLRFAAVANSYILFWFVIINLFGLLKKSSAINVLLLISCWIFLAIGFPAIFNAVADARYPVNTEAFSKYIRRVQMSEDPGVKKVLLEEFYLHYPQYRHTDTVGPSYGSKLYIAYGNLNDRHADPLLYAYFDQLNRRERFLTNCNFLNPVVRCQQAFNVITETDLQNYITYVKNARQYVQVIKEDLMEKCFNEVPVSVADMQHRYSFDQFLKNQQNQTH